MPLPKELTKVTPLSKKLALIVFITLPILAFLLGMRYQRMLGDNEANIPPAGQKGCTLEAKICPDGSTVGRVGPNCEFAPCPIETQGNGQNIFCGGIRGIICPTGYRCQYDGNYPDAGGTCIEIGKDLK